jgi:hypothetical protein
MHFIGQLFDMGIEISIKNNELVVHADLYPAA